MTVSYSQECFNNGLGTFGRLLLRWRGSIYKLLYKEAAIFIVLFYILSITYWYLNDSQKETFKLIVEFFQQGTNLLPITFVLGEFVSFVVSDRWWSIFEHIPWPDRISLQLATFLRGDDERSRLLRRTISRYLVLSQAILFRSISEPVKKRLPTLDHLCLGGLMTMEECEIYKELLENQKKPSINMYAVPVQWACSLLHKARKENLIDNDIALTNMLKEIADYRSKLSRLKNYDWITVPLVYTQVVTIALYSFFLACLLSRQHVGEAETITATTTTTTTVGTTTTTINVEEPLWLEMIFPVFTFLQFLFYMGWLKVAEVLVNPLGCDDDDFETNYILDRAIQISYLIVDKNYNVLPPLVRDKYWSDINPEIPNTQASKGVKDKGFRGSVANIKIPLKRQSIVPSLGIDADPRRRSMFGTKLSIPGNTGRGSQVHWDRKSTPDGAIVRDDTKENDYKTRSSSVQLKLRQMDMVKRMSKSALHIATYVQGSDEKTRRIKRTLIRYMILSQAIVFRSFSEAVRKRLPTLDHMRMGGLMTMEECETFQDFQNSNPDIAMYTIPTHWACSLLHKLYHEKRITNEIGFAKTLKEICNFRSNLGSLYSYDWVTVPLVYTQVQRVSSHYMMDFLFLGIVFQVVTLAVYTFFLATLMSGQQDNEDHQSIYIQILSPLFILLQFLFYMGWLKVAEVLINPMGRDDDDFELNYILDRNIKVAFLIVDKNYNVCPKSEKDLQLLKEQHRNSIANIPYQSNDGIRGSVANLKIPLEQQNLFKELAKKK